MTSKECLKHICSECERWAGKQYVKCPFRSISNEYCDEMEQLLKDLELLEILKECTEVKEKIEKNFPFDYMEANHYINWTKCTKEEYEKVNDWLEREDENE